MKKQIDGIIVPFILLSLVCGLSGCGSVETASPEPTVSDELSDSDDDIPLPSTEPFLIGKTISEDGTIGSWHITFAGATHAQFSDGKTALIVYYDFTNNSDGSISSFKATGISAYQNEQPLKTVHTFDEVPYQHNSSLRVRPGTTLRCSALFEYVPENGIVSLVVSDWNSSSSDIAYTAFDPKNLPGEIGTFDIAPIDAPSYTDGYATQMSVEGAALAIDPEGMPIMGWEENSCIRIYIELTNSGEAPINFSNDFVAVAYQDGIELETDTPAESVLEDSNSWQEIPAGGSVKLSLVYSLRSSDPVEFEIYSTDGAVIGAKYAAA